MQPIYPSPNWIFTFGSNGAGHHGAGAALTAARHYGAKRGTAEGLQGKSYALPTKDAQLKTLSLARIAEHADRFMAFARSRPDLQFQLTRVGCGLAGYTDEQIAPLFRDAPDNVLQPCRWLDPRPIRIIIAGGRDFSDAVRLETAVDKLTAALDPKRMEIVSGMARGADKLGWEYAGRRGLDQTPFPADWDNQPRHVAGYLRNEVMAWYSSHLIAFWDGKSGGTQHMIELAKREGIDVRIVKY
jgi:hypothetical protein